MPMPQRGTRVAVMMLELWTMMVSRRAMMKRTTWVNHFILPGKEALIADVKINEQKSSSLLSIQRRPREMRFSYRR